MNYVKSCLIITMLLGNGYSQCNESNWQDYYPNMAGCQLSGADLIGANLTGAHLNNATLSGAGLCNLAGSPNGDICEESGDITDENREGYDDASYDAGPESGDLNLDGVDNVLDVVILVNNILNP